jgi:hypothetical protein
MTLPPVPINPPEQQSIYAGAAQKAQQGLRQLVTQLEEVRELKIIQNHSESFKIQMLIAHNYEVRILTNLQGLEAPIRVGA